jgi:hypothetical protein
VASATNIPVGQRSDEEASIVYGKRSNITVPGADQTDPAVNASGTIATAAATRETERSISVGFPSGVFQPDAADYQPKGSERSAP